MKEYLQYWILFVLHCTALNAVRENEIEGSVSGPSLDNCTFEINLQASNSPLEWKTPGFGISDYPNNARCVWRVTAPASNQIEFVVQEGASELCCDHVEIYDKEDIFGEKLDTVKGSIGLDEKRFRSTSGTLTISFKSDSSIEDRGFSGYFRLNSDIQLTTQVSTLETTPNTSPILDECLHRLNASEAVQQISSPGWPNNYPSSVNCTWIFQAPSGEQVVFWFSEGETERCCDHVTVRVFDNDTNFDSYKMEGVLQDTKFVSKIGKIELTFVSDLSVTSKGFLASYGTVKTFCGSSVVVNDSAVNFLTTPGWPDNYANNLKCTWNIHAPTGMDLEVIVLEGESESCCDMLQVFQMDSSKNSSIGTVSGKIQKVERFVSSTGEMAVTFKSDHSGWERGYRISYRAIKRSHDSLNSSFTTPSSTLTDVSTTNIGLCGMKAFVNDYGRSLVNFTSPGWPITQYPNSADCLYEFIAPSNNRIEVTILEGQIELCCDKIEAFSEGISLGNYSGRLRNDKIISTNNKLALRFTSDISITDIGFIATYKLYQGASTSQVTTTPINECGGYIRLNEAASSIKTPGYLSSGYPDGITCEWTIESISGKDIEMFELAGRTEECCDHLQILTGSRELLEKYSGNARYFSPNIFDTNLIIVIFKSDGSVSTTGYSASFRAVEKKSGNPTMPYTTYYLTSTAATLNTTHDIATTKSSNETSCGFLTTITKTWQNISTPGWPINYYNNLNCTWTILLPNISNAELKLYPGRTEYCCDYIQMDTFNSVTRKYESIGRQSGSIYSPQTYEIGPIQGFIKIFFSSDSSVNYQGYLISLKSLPVASLPEAQTTSPGISSCLQGMKISSFSNTFDSQKACHLSSPSAGCVTVATNMTIDETNFLVEYKDCVDEISTCQSSYNCDEIRSDDVTNLFFRKASFSSLCHVTCCDRYGTCHQTTHERNEMIATSTSATTSQKIVTQEMMSQGMTTQNMASQHTTTQSMTTENTTTQSMTAENTTTQSMTAENTTTQSMTAENTTTQSMTTENTTTQSMTTQKMTSQKMTTENLTTQKITTDSPSADGDCVVGLKSQGIVQLKQQQVINCSLASCIQTKMEVFFLNSFVDVEYGSCIDIPCEELQFSSLSEYVKTSNLNFDNFMPKYSNITCCSSNGKCQQVQPYFDLSTTPSLNKQTTVYPSVESHTVADMVDGIITDSKEINIYPSCTIKQVVDDYMLCASLVFNNFPYKMNYECSLNMKYFKKCAEKKVKECLIGSKPNLYALLQSILSSSQMEQFSFGLIMNYELLEQICSGSGQSRIKRFLVNKLSNLSIDENSLRSTLDAFIRPESANEFCRAYKNVLILEERQFKNLFYEFIKLVPEKYHNFYTEIKNRSLEILANAQFPKCTALEEINKTPTKCFQRRTDIMFVVQGSGYENSTEFNETLSLISQVVSTLNFDSLRLGFILYSKLIKDISFRNQPKIKIEFDLKYFNNKKDFIKDLQLLKKHDEDITEAYTGKAVKKALFYSFRVRSTKDNSTCIKRIMVLITRSKVSDVGQFRNIAVKLQIEGVHSYVVGTHEARRSELEALLREPLSKVIMAPDISTIISNRVKEISSDLEKVIKNQK